MISVRQDINVTNDVSKNTHTQHIQNTCVTEVVKAEALGPWGEIDSICGVLKRKARLKG